MRLHLYVLTLILLGWSCSNTPIEPYVNDGPGEPENSKPVIQSLTLSSGKVFPGDTLNVLGSAIDDDGDSLIYLWTAETGSLVSPKDSTSMWIFSESVEVGTTPRITLTVTDGTDSTSAFSVVQVMARENNPPQIDSVRISASEVLAGESVQLIVSASDLDGDLISYQWETETGTFSHPNEMSTDWTLPPSVLPGSIHQATVTVSDGKSFISDSVTVLIVEVVNDPPVITSISLSSLQAFPGDTILVSALTSDPDGDSLLIKWSSGTGIILSPNSISTSWIIPKEAVVGTTPTITLTVNDGIDSVSASKSVEIIELVNNVPVIVSVNFSSREVTPGGSLQLSATATDEDGDNLSFRWLADMGELISPDSSATTWEFSLNSVVGQMPTVSLLVSDGKDSVKTSNTISIISGLSLSGHVYYYCTKIPLADVAISINNLKSVSDSEGAYQIDYIPAEGSYEILATKEGFDEYNAKITISEANDTYNLEMKSDQFTRILSGLVQTIDEIRLGGMKIWLLNPDQSLSAISTVSTQEGTYRLAYIPPGERSFFIDNESNTNESLPDTFQLEIKETDQNYSPRIFIKRDVYKEVGTQNSRGWQKVDCELLSDAYSMSGSGGFMRMINLIDIPSDARKLVYNFNKIIHSQGFEECHYGLFNEKAEGESFTFTAGNNTKDWESVLYEKDERFMGQSVYLQFWTTGESSRFLLFETNVSYFW